MPFNGNGVYSLPAGNPVVANTTASSTVHNNTNSDIATALTNCVTKDGQSTPTANIPLGGFKLTNVGAATSVSDAVIASQIQNNGLTNLSSVSNTNTITATVTPVPSAYATGQVFTFEPANNNTGAATINISSLGAKDIYLNNAPLAADVLIAGQPVVIRYNGTQFEIIGKADFASLNAVSQTFAGSVSINNNTTLGDAAGDTVTFNAAAWSAPNGFQVNTDEFVLDVSGNIKINTSVNLSNSKINVNGVYGISDAAFLSYSSGVLNYGGITGAGNAITLLRSFVNNTERSRVTADGFTKASNTGTYGSAAGLGDLSTNTSHNFQSNQNNTTLAAINGNTGSTVTNCDSHLATGATGRHFAGYINTGVVFAVAANGDVTNTNNSYGAISDRKLKNLLQQKYGDGYYERFKQIQFWTYTLINDPTNQKMLGVVAQELQDIFPGLVDSTPDTEKVEITDEDGNTTTEVRETGTVTLSVKYSVLSLIAAMITQELQFRSDDHAATIREQAKQIMEQSKQIALLNARIEALEAK